jgi:hypothetical protein
VDVDDNEALEDDDVVDDMSEEVPVNEPELFR